jgi:hypothetical protein
VRVFGDEAIGGVAGTARFDWDALDAWYEEDEQVFVHPRNPYVRVDALRSHRHVRASLEGITLAESAPPALAFETGLPTLTTSTGPTSTSAAPALGPEERGSREFVEPLIKRAGLPAALADALDAGPDPQLICAVFQLSGYFRQWFLLRALIARAPSVAGRSACHIVRSGNGLSTALVRTASWRSAETTAVREIKDFSRTDRAACFWPAGQVSESAAVPVMPSALTMCCGEGRSMLSV